MNYLGIIKNTLYFVLVTILIVMAVTVVAGKFGIGGIRALVVQSGSMEPAISAKSVVFTAPSKSYGENDVITFKQSGRDSVLVTHRVVAIEDSVNGKTFTTKGDANEDPDGEAVPASDVIGKVMFSIPFIGAVVAFAQTIPGFIVLIIVPTIAIIFSELLNIKKEISAMYFERKQKKGRRISYEKLDS